jgi:uncharacterized protein
MNNLIKKAFTAVSLLFFGCNNLQYNNMDLTEDNFFESQYIPLAKAVRNNDLSDIDDLVAKGLDINVVGKHGMTLVMWAIVTKNKKSLDYILKKGANPNYKDDQGTQPVGYVGLADDTDYLKILLDNGADPNGIDRGKYALIAGIMALNYKTVYMLLDKGANINVRDKDGNSPAIIILAHLNQFEHVAKFMERGADINLVGDNEAPFAYSVQSSTPNKGTDGYEWQKKVKQMLVDRGVKFPVYLPYDVKDYGSIREKWYNTSPIGKEWKDRMEAIGKDPEGFGEKWKDAHLAQRAALKMWMQENNIPEPE